MKERNNANNQKIYYRSCYFIVKISGINSLTLCLFQKFRNLEIEYDKKSGYEEEEKKYTTRNKVVVEY